ncbi:HD domain-containing protein [bacterium]|nr:HD domain-containing protein [bacterium]
MSADRLMLVVEDDRLVQDVVVGALTALGFSAMRASSLNEARVILRSIEQAPQVALVDIHLGGDSGFQLLDEFRILSPDTEFVIMTGDLSPLLPVEAMRRGAAGYLLKPITIETLRHEIARVLTMRQALLSDRDSHSQVQADLELRTRQLLVESGTRHTFERNLIHCLCRLAEYRDNETGAHLHRMAEYCRLLAMGLRGNKNYREVLNPRYVGRLHTAAPLHDIGKAAIPDAVLNKPGKLTDEEMTVMKTHTVVGSEILREALAGVEEENAALIHMGMEICATHHEKWDGSGYPKGLAEAQIPLSGRIAALADFYDALSMPRVYRPRATPHAELRTMILGLSGRHFDPEVVESFLAVEDEFLSTRSKASSDLVDLSGTGDLSAT